MIEPSVPRQDVAAHLARCRACSELLAYARRTADRAALAAWRELLAVHLEPPPARPPAHARLLIR